MILATKFLTLFMFIPNYSNFESNCLEHFIETDSGNIETALPKKVRTQLKLIYVSPIGVEIHQACMIQKKKFRLIAVEPYYAFTADEDNWIYYTEDVRAWYQNKLQEMTLPDGANLNVATLGTLLAHEIGHTPLGRAAFDLPAIDPMMHSTSNEGELVTVFNRQKIEAEEIRATRLFENVFREYIGIPLRRSYYRTNDVISSQ